MRMGRPMKYKAFLKILDDDGLYGAATIVHNGVAHGLLEKVMDEDCISKTLAMRRIRITFGVFTRNHGFPRTGDGWAPTIPGCMAQLGWTGKRWKHAAGLET